MARSFIKKINLITTALFWADFSGVWRHFRKCWPQFLVCFFAIQQTACTYGCGGGDCDEPPAIDPNLDCVPVFDLNAMTGNGYSECEQAILDTIRFRDAQYRNEYGVCTNATNQCALNHTEGVYVRENCPMDHIKLDGALRGYSCNHDLVSIEEGESRLKKFYGLE